MLNSVTAQFTAQLQQILPAAAFPDLSDKYLTEPRGRYYGSAGLLVAPDSTEQVSQIMQAAAQARIAVVPYGGGTAIRACAATGMICDPCSVLSGATKSPAGP